MSALDWSGLIAAIAALVLALARGVPRILEATGTFAKGWREGRHAQEVTAETVQRVVDAMRKTLEERIAAVEDDHEQCRTEVRELKAENARLRERVDELERSVDAQGVTIAKYEAELAMKDTLLEHGEAERAELQRQIGAGGGASEHALPTPAPGLHVDVVIDPRARGARGGDSS